MTDSFSEHDKYSRRDNDSYSDDSFSSRPAGSQHEDSYHAYSPVSSYSHHRSGDQNSPFGRSYETDSFDPSSTYSRGSSEPFSYDASSPIQSYGRTPESPYYENVPSYGEKKSSLGIASLVCAFISLFIFWVPMINIVSMILAIVALILGIILLVSIRKGVVGNKLCAIFGIVLAVVSLVLAIVINIAFFNYLDDESSLSVTESSSSTSHEKSEKQKTENHTLKVGENITLSNGLSLTVDDVKTGVKDADIDDLTYTYAVITVKNTGDEMMDVSPFDWRAEYDKGVVKTNEYGTPAVDEDIKALSTVSLKPGGETSGYVLFEDTPIALEYHSVLDQSATVTWELK